MTYIGSYKDIPYINASLIIEFNHNKYNQTNLAYDGEWKWSVNNRGFSECIFTYLENFTCYTCDIIQHNYNKNSIRDLIKSTFPNFKEQIEKLKMKAFSKMTKNESINLYLKLE